MIPVIRPGRMTEEKERVVEMRRLSEVEQRRNAALPKSVLEQARKMRMNLTPQFWSDFAQIRDWNPFGSQMKNS